MTNELVEELMERVQDHIGVYAANDLSFVGHLRVCIKPLRKSYFIDLTRDALRLSKTVEEIRDALISLPGINFNVELDEYGTLNITRASDKGEEIRKRLAISKQVRWVRDRVDEARSKGYPYIVVNVYKHDDDYYPYSCQLLPNGPDKLKSKEFIDAIRSHLSSSGSWIRIFPYKDFYQTLKL